MIEPRSRVDIREATDTAGELVPESIVGAEPAWVLLLRKVQGEGRLGHLRRLHMLGQLHDLMARLPLVPVHRLAIR